MQGYEGVITRPWNIYGKSSFSTDIHKRDDDKCKCSLSSPSYCQVCPSVWLYICLLYNRENINDNKTIIYAPLDDDRPFLNGYIKYAYFSLRFYEL